MLLTVQNVPVFVCLLSRQSSDKRAGANLIGKHFNKGRVNRNTIDYRMNAQIYNLGRINYK